MYSISATSIGRRWYRRGNCQSSIVGNATAAFGFAGLAAADLADLGGIADIAGDEGVDTAEWLPEDFRNLIRGTCGFMLLTADNTADGEGLIIAWKKFLTLLGIDMKF